MLEFVLIPTEEIFIVFAGVRLLQDHPCTVAAQVYERVFPLHLVGHQKSKRHFLRVL